MKTHTPLTNDAEDLLITDNESLITASEDFGHLMQGAPQAVARPSNQNELIQIISYAKSHRLSICPRGLSKSQGGQSLSGKGGISLDLSAMKSIQKLNVPEKNIVCGAGITWKDLIKHTLPFGLIPPVIPLNTNLSVGGTLSVAGIGTSSYRHSTAASNSISLEVISGNGEAVTCTPDRNTEYYNGTLANLGRCAVLTTVQLALRDIKKNIRTYYLLYDDVNAWIHDQLMLSRNQLGDHMLGVCTAAVQGLKKCGSNYQPYPYWLYSLQLSFEFSREEELSVVEPILKSLHYWKFLHFEDDSTTSFSFRFDSRFEMISKLGVEQQPHPWVECILPARKIAEILPAILNTLPMSLGDGHKLIFLSKDKLPQYFQVPDDDENALLAIAPVGVPRILLNDTLKALQNVHDMLIDVGGKRYLSGWLGMMDDGGWKKHFGNDYENWIGIKKKLDPENVFNSLLFPGTQS